MRAKSWTGIRCSLTTLPSPVVLTSHFILAIFQWLQHRLREAEPGELFAELWQQVMREEAHSSCQRIQHEAQN